MEDASGKKPFAANKVFFDLETNGFSGSGSIYNAYHRIIQISCVIEDKSFCSFVNPQMHIPAPSTSVHGVKDADVATAPPFAEAFQAFMQFISTHTDPSLPTVLIAHNAYGFDVPVLQKECARATVSIPAKFFVYDTLRAYRRHYPLKVSKKLGDLYRECFGTEMENAHDALADSLGLQALFNKELHEKHFAQSDLDTLCTYARIEDKSPVEDISGIGPATAFKLSRMMRSTKSPRVGDLRRMMEGRSDRDIECFIRTQLNQHQESFVFSIWYAITRGHGHSPHYFFELFVAKSYFPQCDKAFMDYWGDETAAQLQGNNVRSVEMLRRYYYYVLGENDEHFRNMATRTKAEFHLMKMLVTV